MKILPFNDYFYADIKKAIDEGQVENLEIPSEKQFEMSFDFQMKEQEDSAVRIFHYYDNQEQEDNRSIHLCFIKIDDSMETFKKLQVAKLLFSNKE